MLHFRDAHIVATFFRPFWQRTTSKQMLPVPKRDGDGKRAGMESTRSSSRTKRFKTGGRFSRCNRKTMGSKANRFLATIYRIWMMRHVDVPDEIARALVKQMGTSGRSGAGRKAAKPKKHTKPKYIPVVATVGGKSTRTTLVPAGGGHYRMQINTAQRKAAGADAGDTVSVQLRIDLAPRAVSVPADLRVALAKHPKARKAFEQMPPGHRRQFLMWFDHATQPETRKRHLDRAIDHLLERALLRPR